jgi:hypothetical protein
MTTSSTRELESAVAELRGLFPEWRFGQLVLNLATAAGVSDPSAIWDVEDDQLLSAARRRIERNRSRAQPLPTA